MPGIIYLRDFVLRDFEIEPKFSTVKVKRSIAGHVVLVLGIFFTHG